MKPTVYITTSWDDGHPYDRRVAELLARYGLNGTFYVPRITEHGTMTAAQLRELSGAFELGTHTVHHVDLTRLSDEMAWQEIVGGKSWLEESTGKPCPMFCPPRGRYSARHLQLIKQAGHGGVRSVELLSLDFPRPADGLMLVPTTVQAHPHGWRTYAGNMLKRGAVRNLWLYILYGRSLDWVRLAESLLCHALERGGVFHLWGHSWELQQTGQWRRLEHVLRFLSRFTSDAPALANWQLCQALTGREDQGNGRPKAATAAGVPQEEGLRP
jgi:hypothetical protein